MRDERPTIKHCATRTRTRPASVPSTVTDHHPMDLLPIPSMILAMDLPIVATRRGSGRGRGRKPKLRALQLLVLRLVLRLRLRLVLERVEREHARGVDGVGHLLVRLRHRKEELEVPVHCVMVSIASLW